MHVRVRLRVCVHVLLERPAGSTGPDKSLSSLSGSLVWVRASVYTTMSSVVGGGWTRDGGRDEGGECGRDEEGGMGGRRDEEEEGGRRDEGGTFMYDSLSTRSVVPQRHSSSRHTHTHTRACLALPDSLQQEKHQARSPQACLILPYWRQGVTAGLY